MCGVGKGIPRHPKGKRTRGLYTVLESAVCCWRLDIAWTGQEIVMSRLVEGTGSIERGF